MSELKFERRVLKLDLYGESYNVAFPTKKQGTKLAEKAKDAENGDDKGAEAVIDLLAELGLPKEKSEEMEIEHLTELVEMLFPSKKK